MEVFSQIKEIYSDLAQILGKNILEGMLDFCVSQNTQKAQKNHGRKLVKSRTSELKLIDKGNQLQAKASYLKPPSIRTFVLFVPFVDLQKKRENSFHPSSLNLHPFSNL